jgi:putative endopeptidase
MSRALSIVLLAAACGSGPAATTAPVPPTPVEQKPLAPPVPVVETPGKPITNTTLAAVGLDAAALDRKADPCEDFYQFACGGWQANAVIAPDLRETMRSFVDIELRNEAYLHDVLEKARTVPSDDPIVKQVGAFYGACMDEAAAERAGRKPIAPQLAQIAKVKDAKSLSAAISALQPVGLNPLFNFGPTEDVADVTKMIGSLDQAGLTLPDRDYYLKDDDASKAMRAALTEYTTAMLVEAGHAPDAAKKEAGELLALETEIAKVSKDKVAMRDPKGTYNKIDRAGVAKAMPHFDWDGFFKAIGQPGLVDITTSAPEFLVGVDKLLVSTPAAVWRNYLTVGVLGKSADALTKRLQDIAFALEQKLSGAKEQKVRWKRCVASTDGALGESLGQIFVRDRFPGASKSAAEEQVRAIVEAMNQNIDTLPWMDATTKTKAKAKAAAMAYHIGYPATWKTYAFKIDPKTYAANLQAARREHLARQYAKIGKPVDRTEWDMTPPTVNAYYNPVHNKMVFPAGILQTPFYQVDHSIAVNLGGIGMVIGHELTHGFDDQGAQFDAVGNLVNWWQPETEKQFKQRTQCVIDQYSKYPAGGATVNGGLTAGENIADIGGVKLALAAYRSLRAKAADTTIADGFTEDQQFFLSFGQTWCSKARPEYEAKLVATDPHSPPRWRVNGALADTPDFAKAFRCKLGATLRPKNACVVW